MMTSRGHRPRRLTTSRTPPCHYAFAAHCCRQPLLPHWRWAGSRPPGAGGTTPVPFPADPRGLTAPVAQPRAAETGTPYSVRRTCNPVLMPGVRKLRDLALVTYESGYDGSTARACAVGSTSEHQEGRAWDWMLDVDNRVDRRVAGHFRSGSPSPDETASGPAGTAARGDVRDLRPAHLVDLLRRRGVACRHRRLSAHRPRPPVVRLGGGLRRHVVLDRAGGGHRLRLVCGVRRPARIADRAGEPRAMFRSGGTGPAYRPPARPAGLQLVAGPGGAPAARVEGGREPRGTAPSTGPTRCCDAVRPGRRWPTCRSRCACRSPTATDSSAPRPRPPYAPSSPRMACPNARVTGAVWSALSAGRRSRDDAAGSA